MPIKHAVSRSQIRCATHGNQTPNCLCHPIRSLRHRPPLSALSISPVLWRPGIQRRGRSNIHCSSGFMHWRFRCGIPQHMDRHTDHSHDLRLVVTLERHSLLPVSIAWSSAIGARYPRTHESLSIGGDSVPGDFCAARLACHAPHLIATSDEPIPPNLQCSPFRNA